MIDAPLSELMALWRIGMVEDYINSFLALVYRDATLSENQHVQLFMAGLVNPLKIDVALCRFRSLDYAIMLAWAYEHRVHTYPIPTREGPATTLALPAAPVAVPMAIAPADASSSAHVGKQPLVTALPHKHLSLAGMA